MPAIIFKASRVLGTEKMSMDLGDGVGERARLQAEEKEKSQLSSPSPEKGAHQGWCLPDEK